MRFLLGASEAGFFPGMILYLTYCFPAGERARAVAKFMTATPIAGVVGAPISSVLLKHLTHSFAAGMLVIGGLALVGAAMCGWLKVGMGGSELAR